MEQATPGTSDPQAPQKPQRRERPEDGDPLAREWKERIARMRKHWDKFHRRVRHNRKLVAGFDWKKNPDADDFYMHRANLIHGTITAILPNIYARNPEISVTGTHKGASVRLLCETIEKVTNRQLTAAKLKKRAKAMVRAALTCSFGVVKVMYQRDIQEDPFIKGRIQDTQDNIRHIESMLAQLEDPQQRANQEAVKAELEETMKALQEKVEIVAGEGLVIDRVLTEHILLDDGLAEFDDYAEGDVIAHCIPMRRSTAEGIYGYKLDSATAYATDGELQRSNGTIYSGGAGTASDPQICILEIWDKKTQRVYTTAEGLDFWIKEPFSPKAVGERWYPFFLLPFQLVDGQVIGPSLVDLTEKLQKEHNETRNKFNAHRDMIKPGYVAGGDISQKNIETFTDAVMGEVTVLKDLEGQKLQGAILPKNFPPIDPMVYDTSAVRFDWEQVSGMQDAARSTVVSPKTATEASIMQQSLSGRVSEFRDQVEDVLQELAQYAAQILLQELSPPQVERIMGPHKTGPLLDAAGNPLADPMTQEPVIGVLEPAYDWPQLSREEVFDLVQLQIRAGTTGEPDKMEQQETWLKLLPAIQPLIQSIMQVQASGGDATPLIALLKETVVRFDEKLDVEEFIPKKPAMPAPPAAPALAPGAVPLQAAV